MKKIRIKARVVPQPCQFRDTCPASCGWGITRSYCKECVPILQMKVRDLETKARAHYEAYKILKERWVAAEKECRQLREKLKGAE